MIDLTIVKERYQRMPDDELIRFTKNESQNLTLESFHLLKSEFEERKLDLTIIESVEAENESAEAAKLSEFEKITANEFALTIWEFAFDEKRKGKSNEDIFNSLLRKKIHEDSANMLIESMEPKARELVDSFDTEIIIGWILSIIGGLVIMFTISGRVTFLLWGFVLVLGGIMRLSTSYIKKRKYQVIVNNIEAEKDVQQLDAPEKMYNTKENIYNEIREFAFNGSQEQKQLSKENAPDKVYGIIMDWHLGEGIATLACFETGDASLYLSSGGGIIGGIGHENVTKEVSEFISSGQNYLDKTIKTDITLLPDKDCVKFYLLTKGGKFAAEETMKNIENESSKWLSLFEQGNKVITELRTAQGKNN